jgi:hypothetical protein
VKLRENFYGSESIKDIEKQQLEIGEIDDLVNIEER